MNIEHRRTWLARATIPIVAFMLAGSFQIGSSAGADTKDQLDAAQAELDAAVGRIEAAAAERDALQAELVALFREIDDTRVSLEQVLVEKGAVEGQMAELTADVQVRQAALDERAGQVYMSGPAAGLEVILETSSLSEVQEMLEFANLSARSDRALIDGLVDRKGQLAASRAELATLRVRLEADMGHLQGHAAALGSKLEQQSAAVARLEQERMDTEALVGRLTEQRQRELAEAHIQQAGSGAGGSGSSQPPDPNPDPPPDPQPDPSPPPPPPPSPPGTEEVQALIVQHFSPLGQANVQIALCVADRESNFDPLAQNPYSGAAGVFQFMPQVWPPLSEAAGWGGASVFDAEANVAVAAWTVAHYGWSPWESDSDICGF